jgi:predicted methyltransferase
MPVKELLSKFQKSIDINERQLERLLSAFLSTDDFWQAIALSQLPFNLFVEACRELQKAGIISFEEEKVLLTEEGKHYIKKELPSSIDSRCPCCSGAGISLKHWENLLLEFKETTKGRPEPLFEYDQGYLTPESTISRIAFADSKGDVRGKSIIILGDDDLLSIAFGLSRLPKRIVVLELDDRLVNFIEKANEEKGLGIEVRKHDLRHPLPDDLLSQFDTFFTDPVETLQGLEVFIGRGIASLRDIGCAGYFGLTKAESSLNKWRDFQRILVEKFGVVITDILSDFSSYENWDYLLESIVRDLPPLHYKPKTLWYKSSLYRIELVKGYKIFNEEGKGELYVDEESIAWRGRERRC